MSIVTKFAIWSVLLLALVGYAGIRAIWNNQNADTHDYIYWQNKYKDVAYDIATDPAVKEATRETPVEVAQYTIQQFPFIENDGTTQQRVDRCESCHSGVENPQMTAEAIIKSLTGETVSAAQVPQYLSDHADVRSVVYTIGAHPGKTVGFAKGNLSFAVATAALADPATQSQQDEYTHQMSKHAFATFGCTTCHYGSGRELIQEKAHGDSEFWLQPLLPSKYMEAACAQCHQSYNVNKTTLTAYQNAGAKDPFAATYLPEMTTIARGQTLFKENACWGCHKIDGYSKGNVGPELTYEGRIATYTSIAHQLWDPKYKVANCVMPYFFSKKIRNVQAQDKRGNLLFNADGSPQIQQSWVDALGTVRPISTISAADVGSPDIQESLNYHGFVPDASRQADVDALITFIVAQTGLNYAQDTSSRFSRISTYNELIPPTVPVSADEGKLVFNQSGCYSCHYQGLPDNPKIGQGGVFGPNLSWEGSRHSRQWIDQHYANPQAFVPKSIMPVFPFSDSERAALTLYDAQYIPKGGKPVSPDQDLPTTTMTKDKIVTPEVRYMTR